MKDKYTESFEDFFEDLILICDELRNHMVMFCDIKRKDEAYNIAQMANRRIEEVEPYALSKIFNKDFKFSVKR